MSIGQHAIFVAGVEMIMIASAMSLAAAQLSTLAWLAVIGLVFCIGIGRRFGRGGSFGFTSEETTFPFADFALEVMNFFLQIGFALDGALMLGPPKVRLLTKFDDAPPMVGSAMALKWAETTDNQEIAAKPGKLYGGVKNSRLPDNRIFTFWAAYGYRDCT